MTKSLGMFEAKLISSLPRLGGDALQVEMKLNLGKRRKWKDKKERNTPQKIKVEDKNILLCCGMLRTPAIVKGNKSLGMVWLTLVLEL